MKLEPNPFLKETKVKISNHDLHFPPEGDVIKVISQIFGFANLEINDLTKDLMEKDLMENPLLTYQTFGGFANREYQLKNSAEIIYPRRSMCLKKVVFTQKDQKMGINICNRVGADFMIPIISTVEQGIQNGFPIFLMSAQNLSTGQKLRSHDHSIVIKFFRDIEMDQNCEIYLLVQEESDLDPILEWKLFQEISD